MAIILFDNQYRKKLFPLTLTRAVAGLRFGILTIGERWATISKQDVFVKTEEYLQPLYGGIPINAIWVDATVITDDSLVQRILTLNEEEALFDEAGLIAGRSNALNDVYDSGVISTNLFKKVTTLSGIRRLEYSWQLFQWNDELLRKDFDLITQGRVSQPISSTNQFFQKENIFIEEGAKVEFSILNSKTGPIYIGKNAEVTEGCMIRGSFALCENSLVKMGAKIYGATIGPSCVVTGEIKNIIMTGYSNKAHDGYLGDSVIGEWCNLGAGTTNSNVKNTAGIINVWSEFDGKALPVSQKCGVIMGDYTRTAINTSINTGSVFGVCCNVFADGLSPKVLNNFSWGTNDEKYLPGKALQDISNWKNMKHLSLSVVEINMLKHLYDNFANTK